MTFGTFTQTTTFTVTHARYLASKVETDLKRIQRFYGDPTDARIANYARELVELLRGGYLGKVTYGYRVNKQWIEPTLVYTAEDLQNQSSTDDDPGRIRANADITGASFGSFLEYNSDWDALSAAEKEAVEKNLPFKRGGASEPTVNGYLVQDRVYSSGGRALNRSTVRSF